MLSGRRAQDREEFACDGCQWDRLFEDGDTFRIGDLDARVIYSPGHTLASITYVIGDAAFIHDTLFMPDTGTARADFPGASSSQLYERSRRSSPSPMRRASSSVTTTRRAAATRDEKARSANRS